MLNNKKEILEFLDKAAKQDGLCSDHVVSQYVLDHWDEIATETYLDTKAKNLAKLLGIEDFKSLTGIIYATGKHRDKQADDAEGWVVAGAVWDQLTEGRQVELKRESVFSVAFGANPHIQGKVVRQPENRVAILPKGKRTRGFVLGAWEKIRFPK